VRKTLALLGSLPAKTSPEILKNTISRPQIYEAAYSKVLRLWELKFVIEKSGRQVSVAPSHTTAYEVPHQLQYNIPYLLRYNYRSQTSRGASSFEIEPLSLNRSSKLDLLLVRIAYRLFFSAVNRLLRLSEQHFVLP
jgi:hypothetical protein